MRWRSRARTFWLPSTISSRWQFWASDRKTLRDPIQFYQDAKRICWWPLCWRPPTPAARAYGILLSNCRRCCVATSWGFRPRHLSWKWLDSEANALHTKLSTCDRFRQREMIYLESRKTMEGSSLTLLSKSQVPPFLVLYIRGCARVRQSVHNTFFFEEDNRAHWTNPIGIHGKRKSSSWKLLQPVCHPEGPWHRILKHLNWDGDWDRSWQPIPLTLPKLQQESSRNQTITRNQPRQEMPCLRLVSHSSSIFLKSKSFKSPLS